MSWCHRGAVARCVALASLALLVPATTGCMSSSEAAVETRINVTMKDFGIKIDRRVVPAGAVELHVHNRGPSTHEINLDRWADRSGRIPLQQDGVTANEAAHHLERIDSIEQVDLDATKDLVADLKPGKYVLWCNLEGHYLGGMHVGFRVR